MGEFIDFGEPRDKYWKQDLGIALGKLRRSGVEAKAIFDHKEAPEIYPSPWEEFEHIKRALYSVRVAERCQLTKAKHNWLWERSREINVLRNALYLQTLRAILFSSCQF